ncbi:MAG: radical SAM protein [bacterium]
MSFIRNSRNAIQQWAWRRAISLKASVHDLDYFFWESTLKCNLTCRHCGSDCTRDSQMPELSADKVMSVFHDIANNYDAKRIMVAVTGGEPLMRGDLFEILAEVSTLGFPCGMVTNGLMVTEKVVENCMQTGMRTVSVSLDGLEYSNNWLRNHPDAYTRAINAIRLLLSVRQFDMVEVITCVHPGNINELPRMYNLLREMGVQGWRIFSIFSKGRAVQQDGLVTSSELLKRTLQFIKEKRAANPAWPLIYCEEGFLGCEWEREVRQSPYYCGAGINIASLLCDGSYSACPSLSRQWIQGHVDELTFHEAWETRYQQMRNRKWMKNDFCADCRQWGNCQASSLHLWDWEQHQPQVCHYRMVNE